MPIWSCQRNLYGCLSTRLVKASLPVCRHLWHHTTGSISHKHITSLSQARPTGTLKFAAAHKILHTC